MKSGQMFRKLKCERTERNTQTDSLANSQANFLQNVSFVCVYACLFHLFKQLTVVQEACDGDYTTVDDPTLYWRYPNNNNNNNNNNSNNNSNNNNNNNNNNAD